MTVMRPRAWAFSAAVLYVGATAAAGLVHVLTGGSVGGFTVPHLLAFPGSGVVTVLLFLTAGFFGPGHPAADASADPGPTLGSLVPVVGGALVNVLLIRGMAGFVRLFVREWAAARRARGACVRRGA
ncbi:hypothetical protein [Streptomyces lateritius]|uniref:hypothetical protein n=1 Tax=Streptomyces lateritius TaxID=67313 RepID=UPI00167635C5|nr:hypothetical protein [Streptomyces lateritius]